MDAEASMMLNYLNKNSRAEWMYAPWDKVKESLEKTGKLPLCLLAFKRKNVDDNASPDKKYMYFYRKDKPRMSQMEFLETHGSNLLRHLKEKFGDKLNVVAYLPSLTITNSVTLFEAHEPPVEKATVSLELEVTFTCLDSRISSILELASENGKEYSIKATQSYDDITSSIGLKLNGTGKHIIAAGLSSSILGDHMTGNVEVKMPNPRQIEVTAGNAFQGNCVRKLNGHNWKIEYKAGYKLDATIDIEKNKRSNRLTPYPLSVRSIVPVTENNWITDRRRTDGVLPSTSPHAAVTSHHWYQDSHTWKEIGACAFIITGIVGTVLTVATMQPEALPEDYAAFKAGAALWTAATEQAPQEAMVISRGITTVHPASALAY